MKPNVIVIVGPTASGKSACAVALAKKLNGEVVSADSRQVYRGLDLGTGKITKAEMRGVPHHLLGVADPRGRFSVTDYREKAEEAIQDILARGKMPIVCGGTGFYISVLLGEISTPDAPPNPTLRHTLSAIGHRQLYAILRNLDPHRAKNIDSKNPRRLIRAIEIAKALGTVPLPAQANEKWNVVKIGLSPERKILRRKIHARLLARLAKGMVAEVRHLHRKGVSWKRMDELGLEYRYISRFLQHKMKKEEMLAALETEIWRYAKRQISWFKRDPEILWFTSPSSLPQIRSRLRQAGF